MTNPTVVFPEAGEVVVDDREKPTPDADEVLVETDLTLVSTGTELTVSRATTRRGRSGTTTAPTLSSRGTSTSGR